MPTGDLDPPRTKMFGLGSDWSVRPSDYQLLVGPKVLNPSLSYTLWSLYTQMFGLGPIVSWAYSPQSSTLWSLNTPMFGLGSGDLDPPRTKMFGLGSDWSVRPSDYQLLVGPKILNPSLSSTLWSLNTPMFGLGSDWSARPSDHQLLVWPTVLNPSLSSILWSLYTPMFGLGSD